MALGFTSMRIPRHIPGLFLGLVLLAQSVSADERVRVELGIDGDPEHLIELLQAAGYEAKMGHEAADHEAEEAQGIWIGRQVAFDDAKEIVRLALSKYPHLRYYTFFGDSGGPAPPEWDHAVYVGGSKWAARGTRAVDVKEAGTLCKSRITGRAGSAC